MYGGIRWLPAAAIAVVACFATPDVHAQAWLQWGKVPLRQQRDPGKLLTPPPHQALTSPMIASIQPQKPAAPIGTPLPAPEGATLPATTSNRRGPSVTIIEEAAHTAPVIAKVTPAAAPAITSPAPMPLMSPPVPVFTSREPAMAMPAQIDDAVVESAPLAATATATVAVASPVCGDCTTQAELQAISATPRTGDLSPEDRQLQSEIKRRLLQGH